MIGEKQLLSILKKAKRGIRISTDEARELFQCHDILLLGRYANLITRRKNGRVVSYIVDRNINYTNICTASCHFCAFSRTMGDPEAYLLSYQEIERKVVEMVNLGGTQVLLQGGLHPKLPLKWYTELISVMHEKFPHVVFHAFSPPELLNIAKVSDIQPKKVIPVSYTHLTLPTN